MNKIYNIIFGLICYIVGMLLLFDIVSLENMGNPFPIIFVLLGSILIELSKENK